MSEYEYRHGGGKVVPEPLNLEEIKARVAEMLSLYPKLWKLETEGRYGTLVWWVDLLPFNVLNESPEMVKLLGFIAEIPEIVPALIAEVEFFQYAIKSWKREEELWREAEANLYAKLTVIRKAAEDVIEEAKLYDGWDCLKVDDMFKALRALAEVIKEK